jgi:hypothetical protein
MLTDCITKPLLKPPFLKMCASMGMIGNGLGIGIRNGLGNGLGTLANGHGNGIALEMASGIPSESKLVGHVCFEEIQIG